MEQEGKEALVHFLRRYTVIDFLGYLIPGAIVTLVWNQRFNGMLKAPFTDFFGEQAVLLGLYFLVLSYLVGTVIHELSKPIDLLLNKILYTSKRDREQSGATLDNVKKIFGVSALSEKEKADPKSKKRDTQERFKKIYHWMAPQLDNTKVPLFHAFSTLGRTGSVTVLLIALLYWTDPSQAVFQSCCPFWVQVSLVIALVVLMIVRCYRFKKTSIGYIYDAFDAICMKNKN